MRAKAIDKTALQSPVNRIVSDSDLSRSRCEFLTSSRPVPPIEARPME